MVWSEMDTSGKKPSPRYLRQNGKNVILTNEKRGNLVDEIPSGWDVKPLPNGKLKLVKN